MLVHLYGKLSWTERVQEICKENNLLIFEDNAQAFGCGYVNSSAREAIRRKLNQEDENITYQDQIDIISNHAIQKSICHTGALGDAGAHSFYPSKNLGALGDAGAVTTDDEELAEAIRALHDYGRTSRFDFEYQGINSRMDEIQAAVLNVKLRHPTMSISPDAGRRCSIWIICTQPSWNAASRRDYWKIHSAMYSISSRSLPKKE